MEDLRKLTQQTLEEISQATSTELLEAIYKTSLGKNGYISQANRTLKDLSPEQKKEMGMLIGSLKKEIQEAYDSKKSTFSSSSLKWDISAKPSISIGSLHPLKYIEQKAIDIFARKGFKRLDGPDIETTYFNFDALNTESSHPARSRADTFYINEELILRTQTTAIQAKALLNEEMPLYAIMSGNTYRRDDDATHSPMFSQLEGIVVDENLSVQHLKGLVMSFIYELLPNITEIRFRSSFFPFTYNSAEVDIKLGKDGKWLEILGCGMIHESILEKANIDPKKYKGLAFGMGLERLTMLHFGITDLRHLYSNNVNFLSKFRNLKF